MISCKLKRFQWFYFSCTCYIQLLAARFTRWIGNAQKRAHTTASSSSFSLHCNVKIPFISRPQRLTRIHDVAGLLSRIYFCCSLYPSISIRAVLARGCELGCVIWFGSWAGTSVLQSSSSFRSLGLMENSKARSGTTTTQDPQIWSALWRINERGRRPLFKVQDSSMWSHLWFTVWLTVIRKVLYWFHVYSRRLQEQLMTLKSHPNSAFCKTFVLLV